MAARSKPGGGRGPKKESSSPKWVVRRPPAKDRKSGGKSGGQPSEIPAALPEPRAPPRSRNPAEQFQQNKRPRPVPDTEPPQETRALLRSQNPAEESRQNKRRGPVPVSAGQTMPQPGIRTERPEQAPRPSRGPEATGERDTRSRATKDRTIRGPAPKNPRDLYPDKKPELITAKPEGPSWQNKRQKAARQFEEQQPDYRSPGSLGVTDDQTRPKRSGPIPSGGKQRTEYRHLPAPANAPEQGRQDRESPPDRYARVSAPAKKPARKSRSGEERTSGKMAGLPLQKYEDLHAQKNQGRVSRKARGDAPGKKSVRTGRSWGIPERGKKG